MWPNPQETADLVTFTEEILNVKLHFYAVVRILHPQILQSFTKTLRQLSRGVLGEMTDLGSFIS